MCCELNDSQLDYNTIMEHTTQNPSAYGGSSGSASETRIANSGNGLARCVSVVATFAVVIFGMVAIPKTNELRTEEAILRQQGQGFLQYVSANEPKEAESKNFYVKASYSEDSTETTEPARYHPFKYSSHTNASGTLNALRLLHRSTVKINNAKRFSQEHECLAQAVYYEARSEITEGQLAVAEVIMNRVADERYPSSICGVVYQGSSRSTGCQFTFTCDGSLNDTPYGDRWTQARSIAAQVVLQFHELRTGNATHYHASYVEPSWSKRLVRTNTIGEHIFYRYPNRGLIRVANNRQTTSNGRSADLIVTPP